MEKKIKRTKEELIQDNAQLCSNVAELETRDERRRKDFAQAFNWHEERNPYGGHDSRREPRVPSWAEIFIELGKILAARTFMDFEGNISELEVKLERLEKEVKKEKNHENFL